MRPVRRGLSPQVGDFVPYTSAKVHLVSRIGMYCSYCERPVKTGLAVEHIQPKSLPLFSHLEGEWSNFLLACINCNSAKSRKTSLLEDHYFPDRDNTFVALEYLPDGQVRPTQNLALDRRDLAINTILLTDLDKKVVQAIDENGRIVAFDRVSQRVEAWIIAEEALADWQSNPCNEVKIGIRRSAVAMGVFSIWMAVFVSCPEILSTLIDAFPGTRASGCFDQVTSVPLSPHPNLDGLPMGGKI